MSILFYFIISYFFFFNDTATTEIYTLSLHDALPICRTPGPCNSTGRWPSRRKGRSEEHTSELQSRENLVCRLLLEKKKKTQLKLGTKKKISTRKKNQCRINRI